MADLIFREATIDYLMTNMGWRDEDGYEVDDADEKRAIITDLVNGIPDVDAVPVVHAQWDGYNADYSDWQRNDGKPIFISCCVCNNVVLNNGSASWKYCPNCGARMDGERRDSE